MAGRQRQRHDRRRPVARRRAGPAVATGTANRRRRPADAARRRACRHRPVPDRSLGRRVAAGRDHAVQCPGLHAAAGQRRQHRRHRQPHRRNDAVGRPAGHPAIRRRQRRHLLPEGRPVVGPLPCARSGRLHAGRGPQHQPRPRQPQRAGVGRLAAGGDPEPAACRCGRLAPRRRDDRQHAPLRRHGQPWRGPGADRHRADRRWHAGLEQRLAAGAGAGRIRQRTAGPSHAGPLR